MTSRAGGEPANPSDANRCIARSKRSGEQCKRHALPGATVCSMHGGRAPQVKAAAARRVALGEALGELERLGVPIDVSPTDAMLDMVREAAGNVAFLRARVQELEQRATAGIVDVDSDGRVSSPQSIAGPTGSTTKMNEAAPHVLVVLYNDERERLVRWSKMCRDAGVEEARVRLAEEQGRQLGQILRATVAALLELAVSAVDEATSADRLRAAWAERAPAIVRGHIEAVTSVERTVTS